MKVEGGWVKKFSRLEGNDKSALDDDHKKLYDFYQFMTNNTIPSPEKMLLDVPLYEVFQADETTQKQIWEIGEFFGPLDCYCMNCRSHSIFNGQGPKSKSLTSMMKTVITRGESVRPPNPLLLEDVIFEVRLTCSRNSDHVLLFIFMVAQPKFLKIGQYPSLADLKNKDVQKYLSVLDKARLHEFTKSIGLASHGVGIGAFVYLRRIFESLIEEAHSLAKVEADWNDEDYQSSRVAERIKMLESFLPSFLVDNAQIYGILSKGIHELKEDECLAHFDVVKTGIELILDEKLEARNKKIKVEEAQKAIQGISSQLSSKI
jgi:hypothetical protein